MTQAPIMHKHLVRGPDFRLLRGGWERPIRKARVLALCVPEQQQRGAKRGAQLFIVFYQQ